MRLALFGATGRAGGAILRESRAAGHHVCVLARFPGALGRDDPHVTAIAGDVRDTGTWRQPRQAGRARPPGNPGTASPDGRQCRGTRDRQPGRQAAPDGRQPARPHSLQKKRTRSASMS